MARAPEFGFPRRRTWNWWALLASVLVHAALLLIPSTPSERPRPPEAPLISLGPGLYVVDMPYTAPLPNRRPVIRPQEIDAPVRPGAPEPAEQLVSGEQSGPPAVVDTGAGVPAVPVPGRQGVPRLRLGVGQGKLWVRPLPLPPGELAQRLSRSHYELVDSAVSEIVQAYIDSVLRAPAGINARPPSWVTTIGGKTFGIDDKNIYLGGLKIPTAILALLPIPSTSNVDLRYAQRMRDIQADLQFAAQRAQTMEDFKTAIRQVREQRQAEQEFERNQRRSPADTAARVP